jgi:hypothetical protein
MKSQERGSEVSDLLSPKAKMQGLQNRKKLNQYHIEVSVTKQ